MSLIKKASKWDWRVQANIIIFGIVISLLIGQIVLFRLIFTPEVIGEFIESDIFLLSFTFGFYIFFTLILLLPLLIFKQIHSLAQNSRYLKVVILPVMGGLMGLFTWIWATLVAKYWGLEDWVNMMYYYGEEFKRNVIIPGIVSGILLHLGIACNTKIRKVIFIIGILIIHGLALYATFFIVAPE